MRYSLLLFVFMFMGMNVMAQYTLSEMSVDGRPIDVKGSRVFVEKQKLDKYSAAACFSSLNGVDRSKDYLKYRAGYKAGLGLTIGGASLAVAGFASSLVGFLVALPHAFTGEECLAADIALYAGFGSMIVGSACFVAGIPMICVYKTRLNRLEKEYNTSIQVGASVNGLSMAFCF